MAPPARRRRPAPDRAGLPACSPGRSCCSRSAPARPRARAWAMRVGALGGAVGARRRADSGRPGAERRGRVRDDRARLPAARRAHRPAAPVAPRPARARRSWRSWRSWSTPSPHTQLLMRSLLGPNPILGARFYGIGNELKSGLAVLVFAAVAAALYPTGPSEARARGSGVAPRSRWPARESLLAVVEGSARIGAGVGGVILVSAGIAVATVMLLRGAVTRRRALIVLLAPIAALVALARSTSPPRTASRPLHGQHPARPLRRRPARRDRPPLHSRLGRAAQPRDAAGHGARAALLGARRCAGASACSPPSRRTPPGRPPSPAG